MTAYWSNTQTSINTDIGYKKVNFNLVDLTGYISKIGYDAENDFLFLPTETVGSSVSGLCDLYSINATEQNWFNFVHGGAFNSSFEAGLWNIELNNRPSAFSESIGIRYILYK